VSNRTRLWLVGAALVAVGSVGLLTPGGTGAKDAGGRADSGLQPQAGGKLALGARSPSGSSAVEAGALRLEVPEDTEGLKQASGAPLEESTWVLRPVSWRRAASGYTIILSSHRSRRNAFSEWEEPKEARTVLVSWDYWMACGRPNLVGKQVEATGLPQLPRPGETESKALKARLLKVDGVALAPKPERE
jgi:hypothetical protein